MSRSGVVLAAALGLLSVAGSASADWKRGCRYQDGRTVAELNRALGHGEMLPYTSNGMPVVVYDFGDGTGRIVTFGFGGSGLIAWDSYYIGNDAGDPALCAKLADDYWTGGPTRLR